MMNTVLLRGESTYRKSLGFCMISVIPFVTYMHAIDSYLDIKLPHLLVNKYSYFSNPEEEII